VGDEKGGEASRGAGKVKRGGSAEPRAVVRDGDGEGLSAGATGEGRILLQSRRGGPATLAAMCCFSGPVQFVSDTGIFARATGDRRQLLAYSMKVGVPEDLAMILPIPVAPGTPEGGVSFINLEKYPGLFTDLARGFAPSVAAAFGGSVGVRRSDTLKVEQVGSFVAAFVPTVGDFSRLDPRFRLPDAVWKRLGQYASFGFAVFQLKKGARRIHPMAFAFPSARPDSLFFPTVHIHDGKVHPKAHFDHSLYCQVARPGLRSLVSWEESAAPADQFVEISRTQGLVAAGQHLRRLTLHGQLSNQDTWLRVA
jgi:hypothetical protein